MAILSICTPAGACPSKLKGTDRNSVMEWADNLAEHGMKNSRKYLPEAVKYWVRSFYEIGSKDYNDVCQILAEELGTTPPPKTDFEIKPKFSEYRKPEPKEEIADIDSFSVGEDEDEDSDITLK